ncbi:MAG: DNA methyltransferase [Candidatus Poribacteria bacterium]|nr:DNA methyltransferase [Candidatus Poribacteria bacterium]
MPDPSELLDIALKRVSEAETDLTSEVTEQIEYICRNPRNRSGTRFLMACLLAKVHNPAVDIRKPYTAIGSDDAYSGRTYDETYVGPFIVQHALPCNSTTAFLTPALRNRDIVLTPEVNLVGNPPELYETLLHLLDDVQKGNISAAALLAEIVRSLLSLRNENRQRLEVLLTPSRNSESELPLSAEAIVTLIEQHLQCPHTSRLPVLVVAAAYKAAETFLGERAQPLYSHTAADKQTGASGDLEITLIDDEEVITGYEMKAKRVERGDIDRALQKIADIGKRVDNYIFITTDTIEVEVSAYAASIYESTGGIEMVILDCIGFLRHFLHLFHRLRIQFLDAYQTLLLAEPESVVRQELKEAFLVLRRAASSGGVDG